MSTFIQQVRSITQDKPVSQLEVISVNGSQLTVQLKYFPIDPTSVVTTFGTPPTTISAETGLLTWTVAPTSGTYSFDYNSMILSDQTIQDLIDVETAVGNDSTDARLIAADALDAMASNQAVIQKVLKMLDLETDGAALAKALRDHAKALRDLIFNPDYYDVTFDFAEQINDKPGFREKITKDWMRSFG